MKINYLINSPYLDGPSKYGELSFKKKIRFYFSLIKTIYHYIEHLSQTRHLMTVTLGYSQLRLSALSDFVKLMEVINAKADAQARQ